MGTLHEDLCTFTVSRCIRIRNRNVSDKSCKENQNTPFMFNEVFAEVVPCKKEVVCKNTVQPDRPRMTIGRMRFA